MGSNLRGRRNAKMNRELRLEISRLGPDIGCRQRQGPGSQMRKAQADSYMQQCLGVPESL